MNERPAVRGVVLAHGTLAEGLTDAVHAITGLDGDGLVALTNRGRSPEALLEAVRGRVGTAPAVVFTDLQSGSCGVAARRLCRERSGLVVISGANLPLLLDFIMHRHLPLEELVPRLLRKGRAAIACAPEAMEEHADRSLPDR